MNRIITLPELADAIASATEISRAESEAFLKDLFALIGERLAEQDDVTVKGLGRFAVIDGEPSFCPDTEFSDGVNQPFAAFEAIELGDDITPDMLEQVSTSTPQVDETATEIDEQPTSDDEEETVAETTPAADESTEIQEVDIEDAEPTADEPAVIADENQPTDDQQADSTQDGEIDDTQYSDQEDYDDADKSHSWKRLLIILLFIFWGVGCFTAGYLISPLHDNNNDAEEDDDIESVAESTTDSITTAPDTVAATGSAPIEVAKESTKPDVKDTGNAVITDTVKSNRYLTSMAREYYGKMEFWVYIYEENANKLGNPNRITPGTVVVIPPAEKYGIDRNNPESVRIAKLKSIEIYKPYEK